MTYEEALTALPEADRQQIKEKLRILREAPYSQAARNIEAERRLPQEIWRALFETMLTAAFDSEAIRGAISESFGVPGRTLRGPELTPPHPTRLGRAATADEFCRWLFKLRYFNTVEDAFRDVQRMLWESAEVMAEHWSDFDLGQYVMWSTFNVQPLTEDPFEGMPDSADGIRGVLGLDRSQRGRPLLLFEFTLPANVKPLFPTIAEAYAGDKWSCFFRPALPDDRHGWTERLPESQNEKPRPETVHKVIGGAQLSAPLRQVI